jgi:hypothetical protein
MSRVEQRELLETELLAAMAVYDKVQSINRTVYNCSLP